MSINNEYECECINGWDFTLPIFCLLNRRNNKSLHRSHKFPHWHYNKFPMRCLIVCIYKRWWFYKNPSFIIFKRIILSNANIIVGLKSNCTLHILSFWKDQWTANKANKRLMKKSVGCRTSHRNRKSKKKSRKENEKNFFVQSNFKLSRNTCWTWKITNCRFYRFEKFC